LFVFAAADHAELGGDCGFGSIAKHDVWFVGWLDGWLDGWIVQYTVGFQLMECKMHNAMMTFFVKKKNESFSPTLNFSDNENEKSARPLIDGMGVIN
jgi:hypothetical protein